ncbi:PREDICTED: NACHT, LRR and PYD domains-containing protein 10-like [Acropora digitifera]|uniref:NACHT, LRR and PYD domains-containing protein 10-like n=1 Tax=Acropora digitifera TaxID=70779 RepID=UPI00077A3389|nr:PREDICTED: NACHT, LRR and PYD domains-containing protein 10-like [Acropora digitifera]
MLLSDDIDISKVVELLKREYNRSRRAEFSPLEWSKGMKLHVKEVYTKLRVVSRSKAGSSEIDVDDIFGSSDEDNDPLVLVEGNPGIGKTTFCLKLAYDWANGTMPRNFPSFKLVFLLKCRDMKGDVVKDIFEQLLPEDLKENTKRGLVNILENVDDQNQICIILDGLDELPEQSRDCLDKVLGRKKLSSCYVLATTRQEKGIDTSEQFKFNRCLAIEGFSKDNSFEFIRKYFRNVGPEDACKGEKVVKRNPLLRKLQNSPLNLLLLCVIYQNYEGSLPSSSTGLYQTIVRSETVKEASMAEKKFEA